MKQLLYTIVFVGALSVMSNVASAQCCQTAYYAPAPSVSYYAPQVTYYAPAPRVAYYAPAAYYAPTYRAYYRPWLGGYRYYARRPIVYYGW